MLKRRWKSEQVRTLLARANRSTVFTYERSVHFHCNVIGSFSNDYGDGNENGKKAIEF